MRIISGTARGKRLATFRGDTIRPTSDRAREALFSILLSRLGTLSGTTVLDLFAGTGAMAIEALSRGASRAVLVDRDPQAARLIFTNLETCGVKERAVLVRAELPAALSRLDGPFDLIFLDPPYQGGHIVKTLEAVSTLGLLARDGIVCAETQAREEVPERVGDLVRDDLRRYGAAALHLFTRSPEETTGS